MLAEERFNAILKLVEEKRTITVQELTTLLDSSESTIRRDLTMLHKHKKLIKVHGGATAIDDNYMTKDELVSNRQDMNRDDKIAIGRYAAALIEQDDFIYIDAGTSTELFIDYITEKNAVYVTNGMFHARKLVQKGCRAYLLGGEFKEETEAIVGAEALESLKRYNFTKGFFGTNGVHTERGFTTPDISEALTKEGAWKRCKNRYVLADASKMNQISSVTFAEFEEGIVLTTSVKDIVLKKAKNIREVLEQ